MNFWDEFYKQPLENIPWQKTQADWFFELLDSGEISGASALDLGCGTGMKSIALAKHGFDHIVGIDVAGKAIEIAKQNAIENSVTNACEFVRGSVLNLDVLVSKKSDLILDWATIHCLMPENRIHYAKQVTSYLADKGQLLIRAFSNTDKNQFSFLEEINGVVQEIHFLFQSDIEALFPNLKLVKSHKSNPRTKPDNYFFTELLFQAD